MSQVIGMKKAETFKDVMKYKFIEFKDRTSCQRTNEWRVRELVVWVFLNVEKYGPTNAGELRRG